MRYVVHGAGAIGATIGARLFEAGNDVVLIARGPHFAALRDGGLRYSDPERTRTLPIPVVEHPREVDWRDDDAVILAMKTQHTDAALADLVASAPPSVAVFCAQNGVHNERLALRHFASVYGVSVILPAAHLQPGVIDSFSLPAVGILAVGCYPSGVDQRAKTAAADLAAAGFSARVEEDVMRWKYRKLLSNLSNAIDAVCGWSARQSDLGDRARAEADACFAAAGIEYASDQEEEERRIPAYSMRPAESGREYGGSSSWQSLARGAGSIEADYLNGEIVLLGRLHGVPTPVNEVLQRQANLLARAGAEPGSMSVEAVLAAAS